MLQALDYTTVQWIGVTVKKIVEVFDAADYDFEEFPSEARLYLPHVHVIAKEAKERKLSSEQLRRLDEGMMHYYEVR
jgi:hypothetical protein